MQISGIGAAVGAGVCAIGRASVIIAWFGLDALVLALPSAVIGLLVGAIAGALGKPIRGAIVGAVLSGLVFESFMCVCASAVEGFGQLFGQADVGTKFLTHVLPYTLLMGAAGAIAGGVGGAVARVRTGAAVTPVDRDPESLVLKNGKTEPEKATDVPQSAPSTEFKELPRFPD
jgi:hypothetical protein